MREFGFILAAGIGSSSLGAGFGWLIGRFAPEFVALLAPMQPLREPAAVAAAMGSICGLLLGAGAMAAGLFISALRSRVR